MGRLFRGEVTIELTDGKGSREIIKGHNMVTNALNYFYKTAGMTNPSAFNPATRGNAIYNLLGGVMLFDTALQESADVVKLPPGVKMIGNGARDILNSGSPPELGSWNERESGEQVDGSIKLVWDFNNDQANGTIAAVSLSSHFGGLVGLGNASGEYRTISDTMPSYNAITTRTASDEIVIGYTQNELITVESLFGVTEWTVHTWANPTREIDIRDNMSPRLKSTKTVQIPAAIQNLGAPYNQVGHWQTAFHQSGEVAQRLIVGSLYNYYQQQNTRYFTDANPALVIKYNTRTDEVTVTSLSPSTTGAEGFETTASISLGISSKYAIIRNYIINLSNIVDVEENTDAQTGHGWGNYTEDIFIDQVGILDAENNSYKTLNYNESSGAYYDATYYELFPLVEVTPNYVWRDPRYLATIYNLETPVVKTADKAMKVTYVIRFSN